MLTAKKLHRTSAWLAGLPVLLIIATGILLQFKKWIPWIQPPEVHGVLGGAFLPLDALLKASKEVPEAQVHDWSDIQSVDIRPAKGVARIRTKSSYEISVELTTARVLQAAPRRTGLIIQLHEGSFLGGIGRYLIFAPAAFLLLGLWGTGLFLLVRGMGQRVKQKFDLRWGDHVGTSRGMDETGSRRLYIRT